MTHSALVVGVGQVGSRFDQECGHNIRVDTRRRLSCASHTYRLAGVCETDAVNAEAFQRRCPDVPVSKTHHASGIRQALTCDSVRAIWCEKPLTNAVEEGRASVEACISRGVHLVVSFVRRWMPLWRRTRELVEAGTIGPFVSSG
jgi:hypothetical protein